MVSLCSCLFIETLGEIYHLFKGCMYACLDNEMMRYDAYGVFQGIWHYAWRLQAKHMRWDIQSLFHVSRSG